MRETPKDARGPILQRTHHVTKGIKHEGSPGLSIQEWTGQGWAIIEVLDGAAQVEPMPLDAASFPGLYVGQRVVTA